MSFSPQQDNSTWITEHDAQFKWAGDPQIRHFKTISDSDTWYKNTHGDCPLCEGTTFEMFERGGYTRVRRCLRLTGDAPTIYAVPQPDRRTEAEKDATNRKWLAVIKDIVEA